MASARERLTGGEPSEDILAAREIRLNSFYLHGRSAPGSKGASVNIAGSITSAELELTIEGASTLTVTVEDPDRHLINSEVLTRWTWGETGFRDGEGWVRKGRAVDAYLPAENPKNRLPFRLVKVSLAGTEVTLTFEDRIVALLRQHKGARKLSRAKGTRAMFIKMLADEVKAYGGVPVFIPELRKRQPIAKASDAESEREKRENARPGIADGANLTVKGAPATREQIRNMERVLDVADSLNAGPKATKALVLGCIVESQFRNLPGGHADSRGILQVRDKTARHMGINNRDVEQCAHAFLTKGFWGRGSAIELARRSPSQTAGWVAWNTLGPARQYRGRYDQYSEEADAILRAYKGGGGRRSGETYTKQYVFERGKDEDSWTAMGRLAEEVAWRRFVRKGRLWYVSEEYLFNQRAAMTIDLDHPAVEDVQLELDPMARHPIAEVTLSARVGAWQALPGMVVVLKDAGPASGRWLVSSVRRDLFDSLAEVRLTKPIDPKPEPRSETVERQRSGETDGIGSISGIRGGDDHLYGGSRGVINEVIRIVGDRAPITSRKRPANHPLSRANPSSDHNEANRTADAVDFGIANAYDLAREIAARLGGKWTKDYESFVIRRNGKRYRVQIIAGTHGTGPHLHVGVRRWSPITPLP